MTIEEAIRNAESILRKYGLKIPLGDFSICKSTLELLKYYKKSTDFDKQEKLNMYRSVLEDWVSVLLNNGRLELAGFMVMIICDLASEETQTVGTKNVIYRKALNKANRLVREGIKKADISLIEEGILLVEYISACVGKEAPPKFKSLKTKAEVYKNLMHEQKSKNLFSYLGLQ